MLFTFLMWVFCFENPLDISLRSLSQVFNNLLFSPVTLEKSSMDNNFATVSLLKSLLAEIILRQSCFNAFSCRLWFPGIGANLNYFASIMLYAFIRDTMHLVAI